MSQTLAIKARWRNENLCLGLLRRATLVSRKTNIAKEVDYKVAKRSHRGAHGATYGAQLGAFNKRGPSRPDGSFEKQALDLGFSTICGVDEAGRGPLAGPVVAAAVILPHWIDDAGDLTFPQTLSALNDSKQITQNLREHLFDELLRTAEVSIASVGAGTIDTRNIRKASLEAMRLAVLGLPTPAGFALVDGKDEPPSLPCASTAIIKGDGRSLSIAAASICAKVARDRMMVAADQLFPQFGFASHKGYATQTHRDALQTFGPCPLHRRTFAPVREALMAAPKTTL
jgi:ribonuclease HII